MPNRVQYENLIVLLYIFDRIDRGSGNLSTAKLIFLAEDELFQKKMIGPHYKMRKHEMGPYNSSIGTQIKNLGFNNYLKYEESFYEKTNRMEKIYSSNENTSEFLKEVGDLIQEYSEVFDVLDKIVDEYGKMNGEELMRYVYTLDKAGMQNKPINDYEDYTAIINPDRIRDPKVNFQLDENWYDTVEILLNPDLRAKIKEGMENLKNATFTVL